MLKRITSVLTALAMTAAASPVCTAAAESGTVFLYDEHGFLATPNGITYGSPSDMAFGYRPQAGDILCYHGSWTGTEMGIGGVNLFYPSEGGYFERIGSVLDGGAVPEVFTVTDQPEYNRIGLTGADGKPHYIYKEDSRARLETLSVGDTVEFYTYEGSPVLPAAAVDLPDFTYITAPGGYLLRSGSPKRFDSFYCLNQVYTSLNAQPGDLIYYDGAWTSTALGGTNELTLTDSVTVVGNLADYLPAPEPELFTVTDNYDFMLSLTDCAGTQYYMDTGIDSERLTSLSEGDQIFCYTHEGIPLYPVPEEERVFTFIAAPGGLLLDWGTNARESYLCEDEAFTSLHAKPGDLVYFDGTWTLSGNTYPQELHVTSGTFAVTGNVFTDLPQSGTETYTVSDTGKTYIVLQSSAGNTFRVDTGVSPEVIGQMRYGNQVTFYSYRGVPMYPVAQPRSQGTISNDRFTYTYGTYHHGSLTLADGTRVNAIVTGVYYKEGSDKPFYTLGGDIAPCVWSSSPEDTLGEQVLQVGDLLYLEGDMLEVYPGRLETVTVCEYIGHGRELLGEEFDRVMRLEMDLALTAFDLYTKDCTQVLNGLHLDYGDLDGDGEISLLDVITLNRSLLGVQALPGYAGLCADVDGNGAVDASDSLYMLRYTVSLETAFPAQGS